MKILKKQKTGMKSLKQMRDRNNWQVIDFSNSEWYFLNKSKYRICPCCGEKEEIRRGV